MSILACPNEILYSIFGNTNLTLEDLNHLSQACARLNGPACKVLFDRGAFFWDAHDVTGLHHAVALGCLKAVQAFLQKFPLLNLLRQSNKDTETALHCAARGGNVEVVDILLENPASLDCIYNDFRIFRRQKNSLKICDKFWKQGCCSAFIVRKGYCCRYQLPGVFR